ncbi:hypothetical protein NDU88_002300, partial [Pleurodeles waltl]
TLGTMASTTGNGVLLVTQYIPASNNLPSQQEPLQAETPGYLKKFIKGEPKALGVVQIMIGIIHISLGGVLCTLEFPPMSVVTGVVFWGGL